MEPTLAAGPDLGLPRVGRAAAFADIDNDGDLDILMTTHGGPAVLFRNDGTTNHSLRIKLEGTRSNRDGIGTLVTVKSAGQKQSLVLRSGSGYLSASELVLTFGLGTRQQADEIEFYWPSGQIDRLLTIPAGRTITVRESVGVVQQLPYGNKRGEPASTAIASHKGLRGKAATE